MPTKCSHCGITRNLWICLTCGHVGCSRQNVDGSGGKGHAFAHFKEEGHPLSVKVGTISADGVAGVYFDLI